MRIDAASICSVSKSSLRFEELSSELQDLLAEAVDRYVIEIEEGRIPDRQEYLNEYPSISKQLAAYIDEIEWLYAEADYEAGSRIRSQIAPSELNDVCSGLSYDDFEIEDELGRGAMGIVYRAFQKSLQRWVAVKVLPYSSVIDESRTMRFWREAKIAGALEHPGIVSVFGVGRHRDMCFYAMSLVEGKSLDLHLSEAEDLSAAKSIDASDEQPEAESLNPLLGKERFRKIARIIHDAADAIEAAHAAGIIHRDIKPSNLILDLQGRIKVTDFGLAMDTGDLELTRSGEVVGTIRYMSPEQAAGKRGLINQRSDVYCLGATLYELLTRTPPFASQSLPQVVREKEEGILRAPRSIDASIPKALQTITLKAMRASANDRYQSAGDLARDLQLYLEGKPISATDRSLVDVMIDWSRRNTGIMLTAFVAMAMLFGLAVTFNIAQTSRRIELQRALEERERHYLGARNAVDQLGIQFAEKLESLPEAVEFRRDLLKLSLDYYVGFLKDAQHDVRLSLDAAEAKWKIAQATVGLESIQEAEHVYQEADDRFVELAKVSPEAVNKRAEMLSDWAMKYMVGYQGEAKSPRKAIEILDRASTQESSLPRETQALVKNNRAYALAAMGRLEEAVSCAKTAVQLLKQSEQSKSERRNLESLIVSMLNLSQILDQAKQSSAAIEIAQQCVWFAEEMLEEEEEGLGQLARMQTKAKVFATNASLLWKYRGADSATASLKKVVEIRNNLLESSPGSTELRWDLAISLNNLGMALSSLEGNETLKEARLAFEKAYAIAKAETEVDSQNAIAAHRTANIQNNLGLLLRRIGHRSDAANALRSAAIHIDRSYQLDGTNAEVIKARDRIFQNLQDK